MSIIPAAAATTAPAATTATTATTVLLTLLLATTIPLSLYVLIRRRRSILTGLRPSPDGARTGPLFLALVFTFAVWTLASVILAAALNNLPVAEPLRPHVAALLATLTGIAAALYLTGSAFGLRNAAFPLSPPRLRAGLTRGVLAFLLTIPWVLLANSAVEFLLDHFHVTAPHEHEIFQIWDTDTGRSPAFRVLVIVTATLVAPVFEELLFRGLLQTTLLTAFTRLFPPREPRGFAPLLPDAITPPTPPQVEVRHSPLPNVLAILATSVCFAAIHTPWTIQPAIFILSLALGYAYERSNNLWLPITLHALFNAFNIVLYLTTRA